jgi:pimeloyl-ACP methyl ester carboxylesterase
MRPATGLSDARFDAKVAATLGAPTLLLVGSDGHGWNEQEAAVVAAALPRARVRVLDGQAHVAHLAAPQWFAEVVLDFLAAA